MCICQMLTFICSGPQLGINTLQNSSEKDDKCRYNSLEFLLEFMHNIFIMLLLCFCGYDFCKALTYFYLQKTSALACIKTNGTSLEAY